MSDLKMKMRMKRWGEQSNARMEVSMQRHNVTFSRHKPESEGLQ